MSRNIQDVWTEALADQFATTLDSTGYEARIVYGCRIVKDRLTNEIELYNTGQGGDYYQKLNEEQEKVFIEKGWRYGCYVLSLSNYRRKLSKIEKMIRNEMNGKKNPKQVQSYKTSRENLLNQYAEISKKLNKIK